jgi:hypothetical protein
VNERLTEEWQRLLARVMPFGIVIDEETSWGEQVRVSQTSVCGSWGAIVGDLRYFSDRFGRTRGSIEGTQIPYELVWEYAKVREGELVYDPGHKRAPLRLRRVRIFHDFELDADETGVESFPPDLADDARRVLAEATAAGAAYHRDVRKNREAFRELREVFRRSGGATRDISESSLKDYFSRKLERVTSYSEFVEADLTLNPDDFVPRAERKKWLSLPDTVSIRGAEYPLDYGLEGDTAIARARIPEKIMWQLTESDLPVLDRPLQWTVLRGKKGAVRASTLAEARELVTMSRAEIRARSGDDVGGRGGGRPGRSETGSPKGGRSARSGERSGAAKRGSASGSRRGPRKSRGSKDTRSGPPPEGGRGKSN